MQNIGISLLPRKCQPYLLSGLTWIRGFRLKHDLKTFHGKLDLVFILQGDFVPNIWKYTITILNFPMWYAPPCCYHKGQIVNSTMFDKGRLTLILFFQLNLSYINKPFRKMPKNSNFLIRLETGCTDCLLQVYTKENKRKVTWYGQQNLSLVNTIE